MQSWERNNGSSPLLKPLPEILKSTLFLVQHYQDSSTSVPELSQLEDCLRKAIEALKPPEPPTPLIAGERPAD